MACSKNAECKFWTYVKTSKRCYMKTYRWKRKYNTNDVISGPKTCERKKDFAITV